MYFIFGEKEMSKTFIPEGYKSTLGLYDTQSAIGHIKRSFEDKLCVALNLKRVSAPLFVDPAKGLNDNLNGVERPVIFDVRAAGHDAEIVHSLAKWKRLALKRYEFKTGKGLYTDMNAIRRDEDLDNLHSVYVDQWDWEKVITREDRTLDFLKSTVTKIVKAILYTLDEVKYKFPDVTVELCPNISFVTTQELEDMYPTMTGKERENAYLREHKTACILQIGDKLKSGKPHDGRAPDYDDWALNCDIMFYNEVLDCAFEISSMGIRVDENSLREQLEKAGCEDRAELMFHKMLLNGELPLTMGGGIGQSRLCMLLLGKAHIGEVQVSLWDQHTATECEKAGVTLL